MTDFKIRRGLSEQIFEDKLTLKPHSRLLLEEGTWYLCTDTAELFLGLLNTATGKIELKQINGSHNQKSADRFYINTDGELCVVFSDGTEEPIGKVTGEENNTIIKIGTSIFNPENGIIELPDFATKNDISEAINKIELPDVSDFITIEDVEAKGYLTEHQDLSEYAKKSEIPSVAGFASEDFVRSEIAKAELNGGEVTEEELGNLLANYYNKTEVDNKFEEFKIPSTEGLATEEFVNNAIADIEIPEAELFVVDFAVPDFTAAINAYNNGKFLVLANAAPDANGYAVMNYVRSDMITFTKFLTSRSEAYGSFNTYYLHSDNTWEVSKEVKLNKVEANASGEVNGELTSIRIGKEIYSLPNTNGLASEQYVKEQISALEIPEVPTNVSAFTNDAGYLTKHQDLSEYAKKSELPTVPTKVSDLTNDSNFITAIPAEYITESELDAKGYLSEHQSLEGLATEEFVRSEISLIDIPETDLSEYSTTSEMNTAITAAIVDKADDIPFTTTKIVVNSIGNLKEGEDVSGLTITEIFAKLLGFVDEPEENPDTPDDPIGNSIVAQIMGDRMPMYQLASDGELVALTYDEVMDIYDAQQEPTESGFYKLYDADNNVIEYGYQQMQVKIPDVPFMIALPDIVDYNKHVTMETYSDLTHKWEPITMEMTSDSSKIAEICDEEGCEIPEVSAGYTLWVSTKPVYSSDASYRFIITEEE